MECSIQNHCTSKEEMWLKDVYKHIVHHNYSVKSIIATVTFESTLPLLPRDNSSPLTDFNLIDTNKEALQLHKIMENNANLFNIAEIFSFWQSYKCFSENTDSSHDPDCIAIADQPFNGKSQSYYGKNQWLPTLTPIKEEKYLYLRLVKRFNSNSIWYNNNFIMV